LHGQGSGPVDGRSIAIHERRQPVGPPTR
jgi:hypothetical protein